ncbi:hypothetical protein ACLI4Q_06885 [Natrialbaceae archaeon A-CW1-1]
MPIDRTAQWCAVDDWWKQASTTNTETVADLQALFEALNEQWRDSPACFDRDPLCAEWRGDGPLRTSQEENWSQWAAHLCDTAPPTFTADLFGVPVTESPDRVQCEVPLSSDTTHDRRADILIQYPDTGISIEVKIDDENYAKTPDTARLIEHHDRKRTWKHYLLLPKSNHGALRATTGSQLDDGETRSILRGTQPDEPDVAVLYWRDISQHLRQTLLTDATATPHWQANAYSFITIIETVLCQFAPAPLISNATSGSTGFAEQTRLRNTPLTDQYTYLTTHTNE